MGQMLKRVTDIFDLVWINVMLRFFGNSSTYGSHSIDSMHVSECMNLNLDLALHASCEQAQLFETVSIC